MQETNEQQVNAVEIGRARRAEENERLLRGAGQYLADVRLPGLLYAAFVRSTHAHARLNQIDTSRAAQAPGVVQVLTATDLAMAMTETPRGGSPELRAVAQPWLARAVVHAVGVPIVAVIADSEAHARDAVDLVDVDYEPLPAITDPLAARAEGAPLVHPELGSNIAFTLRRGSGDVDEAFARAERVVALRLEIPRLAGVPLEPLGMLAHWEPGARQFTAWCTTQAPWRVHAALGAVLGLPAAEIRVIAPNVGGGFGVRGPVYGEYVVIALAAYRLGRPVRWTASRSEDFQVTQSSRETVADASLAATNDGRILGLRAQVTTNLGAYATSFGTAQRIVSLTTGPYRIPAAQVEVSGVYTNTGATGAYRGAGRPEAAYIIERLVEELARELGLDAVALRRRNFVPADEFPYQNAVGTTYDSGQYAAALDLAVQAAHFEILRDERARRLDAGMTELLGIGLASYIEPTGGGWESGRVRVEPNGKVIAVSGSVAQGQGHLTTFAQIIADRLGVPFSDVIVREGDTADGLPGVGTFGSRSTALGGGALTEAADEVFRRARQIAAHLLEASPADVVARAGRFAVVGVGDADRSVSWAEVATAAASGTLPADIAAELNVQTRFEMQGEAFANGTCVAVVTVDVTTGVVRVRCLLLVHDCGTTINPRLVAAQLHGGLAQGLGEVLGEWLRFDTDGQLLTGSFMDYWLPRADDVPSFELAATESPSPLNALGAKGVGEAGTIAAPPALVHAVLDALRPIGVADLPLPYTPDRVWRAIQAAKRKA